MTTTNAQKPLLQDDFVQFTIKDRIYFCRPIKGYSGYFASTSGHIISLVTANRSRLRKLDWSNPQLLTGSNNGNRYLQVRLYTEQGHSKFHLVHRLVAMTHLEKPISPLGMELLQVNHVNKDRQDNATRNLCWTTAQENADWNKVMKAIEMEANNV